MSGQIDLMWLAEATLKSAIALTVTAGLAVLMRRGAARPRHLMWGTVLLGVLLVPAVSHMTPSLQLGVLPPVPDRVTTGATALLVGGAGTAGSLSAPVQTVPAAGAVGQQGATIGEHTASASLWTTVSELGLTFWLLMLWLAGAIVVVAGLVRGLIAVGRLTAGARSLDDGRWLHTTAVCSEAARLTRPVRLLVTAVPVPMTWGFLRPVVLLPEDANSWPEERRRVVLLHELFHVKHNDWLIQITARLACAMYWFNPLVWVAARRLAIEREKGCDEDVVAAGTRPSVYAHHVLRVAQSVTTARALPIAALAMARHSNLEARLMSILKNHTRAPRRAAWSLPVVAGMLLMSLAVVEPRSAGPEFVLDDPDPKASAYSTDDCDCEPGDKSSSQYTPAGKRGGYSYDSNFSGTMTMNDRRVTYRYGFRNGIFVFEERIDGDINLHLEVEGEVEFGKDGTSIIDMDPDGFVLIETRDRGSRLSLEVTADDDGKPRYEWRVNHRTRPVDDDGKEWMATALSILRDRLLLAEIHGERSILQGRINSIHGERNALHGRINSIHAERNALRGRINAIHGERNSIYGGINRIHGQRNALHGKINSIHGQRNSIQGKINSIYARRNSLNGKINSYRSQRRSHLRQRRWLRSQGADKEDIAKVDKEIQSVEDNIAEIEKEIDDLKIEERVDALRQEIDDLDIEERVQKIRDQIDELDVDGEVESLREQIDDRDIEQRVRDIEDLIDELEVDDKVAALEKEIDKLNVEDRVEEIEEQIRSLNTDERAEEIEERLAPKYRKLKKLSDEKYRKLR